MLEANKNNSKVIPKSSSIKLTRAYGLVIFSLNFKHIVMANCNALKKKLVAPRLVQNTSSHYRR
jgi:hypothetical protein